MFKLSKPWTSFTNQNQWKEYLQNLIRTNDTALYRAIILISDYQTDLEKATGETREVNHKGFSSVDAEFLTDISLKLRGGKKLTDKQKAISRNKMVKYWKQLMLISKDNMRRDSHENKTA